MTPTPSSPSHHWLIEKYLTVLTFQLPLHSYLSVALSPPIVLLSPLSQGTPQRCRPVLVSGHFTIQNLGKGWDLRSMSTAVVKIICWSVIITSSRLVNADPRLWSAACITLDQHEPRADHSQRRGSYRTPFRSPGLPRRSCPPLAYHFLVVVFIKWNLRTNAKSLKELNNLS